MASSVGDEDKAMREQEPDDQSLTGVISQVGISRGKTIAAWNGVPPPHPFLLIQREWDEQVYAWFPQQPPEDMERLVGKRVRLTGRWVEPPAQEAADIDQPMQQPMEQVRAMDTLSPLSVALEEDGWGEDAPAPADSPQGTDERVWIPVARQPHFQADQITFLQDAGAPRHTSSVS